MVSDNHSQIKIISGGQTGVERAALDVAHDLGLDRGGWCPKGRKAEDGRISTTYPLFQTVSLQENESIDWNVRDSDATLILAIGEPKGVPALAIELALKRRKPYLVVDLQGLAPPEKVTNWIRSRQLKQLHVVGPAASESLGIYDFASAYLKRALDFQQ